MPTLGHSCLGMVSFHPSCLRPIRSLSIFPGEPFPCIPAQILPFDMFLQHKLSAVLSLAPYIPYTDLSWSVLWYTLAVLRTTERAGH